MLMMPLVLLIPQGRYLKTDKQQDLENLSTLLEDYDANSFDFNSFEHNKEPSLGQLFGTLKRRGLLWS